MAKRNVEIEDSLEERAQGAIDDVRAELLSYLEQNPGTDKTPCINNDLDYSGTIHEIVDGSVPIYTKEIEDTWYLYASELEQAYENAGAGHNPRENNGMAAIYYYIYDQVQEWYRNNADDVFEEWQKAQALEHVAKLNAEQCASVLRIDARDVELKQGELMVDVIRAQLREALEDGDVEPVDVLAEDAE